MSDRGPEGLLSLLTTMINIEPPSSTFDLSGLAKSGLARFLNSACRAVELAGEVDVLLTSDAELKRLNKAFRGKNKATDVLSFPAPVEAEGMAGDLAISLETAARQAVEHGHSLRDEVRVLMLHGVLHLAGEDHEADTGEMATREASLRRQLRLPIGLIARAAVQAIPPVKKTTQPTGARAKPKVASPTKTHAKAVRSVKAKLTDSLA